MSGSVTPEQTPQQQMPPSQQPLVQQSTQQPSEQGQMTEPQPQLRRRLPVVGK